MISVKNDNQLKKRKGPEYIGAQYGNTCNNSITSPVQSLYATTTFYLLVHYSLQRKYGLEN
jgi:hypothetical protein